MLTTPILLSTSAWDATTGHTFSFNAIGSSQVTKNRLIIKKQSTEETVYDETVSTLKYKHEVSFFNSLENGVYYSAQVQTFDISENSSDLSAPIQFWCYTMPTISFTNIPDNNIITNTSYSFTFEYTQKEGELLDFWNIELFNSNGYLVSESGYQYPASLNSPLEGTYTFDGMNDGEQYSIEIVGKTVNGYVFEGEKTYFNIKYEEPSQFTVLQLKNNVCKGYIEIKSNAIIIDGKSNPDPPNFIKDNSEVNLTDSGTYVYWDEGYNIEGDWIVGIWGNSFNVNTVIFLQKVIENIGYDDGSLNVYYRKGYEDQNSNVLKTFVELEAIGNVGISHIVQSNFITNENDDEVFIWIKHLGGLFNINIEKVGEIT